MTSTYPEPTLLCNRAAYAIGTGIRICLFTGSCFTKVLYIIHKSFTGSCTVHWFCTVFAQLLVSIFQMLKRKSEVEAGKGMINKEDVMCF